MFLGSFAVCWRAVTRRDHYDTCSRRKSLRRHHQDLLATLHSDSKSPHPPSPSHPSVATPSHLGCHQAFYVFFPPSLRTCGQLLFSEHCTSFKLLCHQQRLKLISEAGMITIHIRIARARDRVIDLCKCRRLLQTDRVLPHNLLGSLIPLSSVVSTS